MNENQAEINEKFRRERFNRQNDEIRVHNPTNEDHIMDYDGVKWLFPNQQKDSGYGLGDRVVPRYVAQNFMEEMLVVLIQRESDELMAREKKNFRGDWWAGHEEQNALRTNNRQLREKYLPLIYKGVEKKYGDEIEIEAPGKVDSRPITEVMMEKIDAERAAKIAEISGESETSE